MQLVLALEKFNKQYQECNRSEKNKLNSIIHAKFSNFESVPYIIEDSKFELRNHLIDFLKTHILNKKNMLSKDRITYMFFLKNNWLKEYNYIFYTTFYLKNVSFQERIYHIINNIKYILQCENCENCNNNVNFLDFGRGYRRFCSIVCSKNYDELKRIGIVKENKLDENKKEYYKAVRRETYKSLKINNINPNNLPIGINGSGDVYQVDHIIPIIEGYKSQIDPKIIGDINNLQLLHWRDNNKKSVRNDYKLHV